MAEILKKGRIESQTTLKKQFLSIGIVAMLLVGGWYGITALTTFVFQSDRYERQKSIYNTDYVPVELSPIAFPNITIDPSLFNGFDPNNIPDWLLQAMMGAGALSGDFGGFENLEQLNNVVFRLYPEDGTPMNQYDKYRYTAYENYNGNEWTREDTTNFPLGDVPSSNYNQYDYKYTIRMPFSAAQTQTSMGIPSGFPSALIGQGSVGALDNNNNNIYSSSQLYKDTMNGSTMGLTLTSTGEGNASYYLLRDSLQPGIIHGDDNSDSYWESNSISPIYAPVSIKNKYLQIPGGFTTYYNSHPNYKLHYDNIQTQITLIGATTTYEIADVIRSYLAANFNIDLTFPLDRPDSSEDIVEWFLEGGEGLPMDFAAAFVILARGFNIPCRYAFGYNSMFADEVIDTFYYDKPMYEIRFTNMDAWNEIYFPTDVSGAGQFSPMYIKDSSLVMPQGGSGDSNLAINILMNGTYSNQYVGVRDNTINLTFGLNIPVEYGSNVSQTLDLYDHTADVDLGSVITDANGYASYMLHMDNSFVAGAHAISVTHSPLLNNFSVSVLIDQVNVVLNSINDTYVDRSTSNDVSIQARIYDPLNGQPVRSALLRPVVIDSGYPIIDGTNPSNVKVDSNGYINEIVEITPNVDQGLYQFRVDFNGTYEIDNPYDPENPAIIDIGLLMSASSASVPLTVVDPNQKVFDLYINTTYTEDSLMNIDRSITKISFSGYLKQGVTNMAGWIDIFDSTYSNFPIISFYTSGVSGWGYIDYYYSGNENDAIWISGLHELYGVWRETGRRNETFYVFNDENTVDVSIYSFPVNEINTTGPGVTEFTTEGYLWDYGFNFGGGAYVRYGELFMHFFKDGNDRPDLLTVSGVPNNPNMINVGSNGLFSVTRGVIDTMDQGEWSVWVDFNGSWSTPTSFYNEPNINDSTSVYKVNVTNPGDLEIELWINSTSSKIQYYPYNPPTDKLFMRNDDVNITIRLRQGLNYLFGQSVNIFFEDGSGNTDFITTGSGGYGENLITLDSTFRGGFIRFYVEYMGVKTYGQLFLNDTFEADVTTTLTATYSRTTDLITVAGVLRDSIGHRIGGGRMELHVYDKNEIEVTSQITNWVNGIGGVYYSLETGVNKGDFIFQFRAPINYHGEYNFTVEFTGYLQDSSIQCSAYYSDASLIANSIRQETIIYANVQITATYLPHKPWTMWNYVNVTGTLKYDNGTSLPSYLQFVNITFIDSSNILCNFDSYNDTATWIGDSFDARTIMHWSDAVNIYVDYYRDDTFGVWISSKRVLTSPG